MKTLTLILLIFCINMQGQDMKISNYGHTDVDFHDLWVVSLLKEYSEYEKECYNDSTEIVWCGIPLIGKTDLTRESFDDLKEEYPNDIHYIESAYEHKHPTFTDFIAWLRKKYNR